jgi:small subunit ribosomal protein S4
MPNQPRPRARLSRALGVALTPKCARVMERKPYPPGEHGRARRKEPSGYKLRLREKQRLRAQYDVGERQLRRAFERARAGAGKTGEALVAALETRLDAVVLRAGFARTIYQARQFVSHQHVTVNGRRVDRPSYQVRPGDVVAVAERSRGRLPFVEAAAGAHTGAVPPYLDVAVADLRATLVRMPARTEVPVVCDEQLVVEHYSR